MTTPDKFTGTRRRLFLTKFTGVRTFLLDRHTMTLTSPVYRETKWMNGVNTAHCTKKAGNTYYNFSTLQTEELPEHKVGDQVCSCGFYGFYQGEEGEYYRPGSRFQYCGVQGIIHGWGNLTHGTKGFRCAKAEIVALVRPLKLPDRHIGYIGWDLTTADAAWRLWPDVQQNYPRIPIFDTLEDACKRFPARRTVRPATDEDGDAA